MYITLVIKGVEELIQKFLRGRQKLGEAVWQSALDLQREIKSRASVRTGRLVRSIYAAKTGDLSAKVGVGVYYAVYVEYGTRPHIIRAHGRALRFEVGGKVVFAKYVRHPGMKPQYFVKNSLRLRRMT